MRESSTDTTLASMDGGIVMTGSGTVTLPSFDASQLGFLYNVKNASAGVVNVNCASGEVFQEAAGNVSTMALPSNVSLQFGRNATATERWVIQ